MLTPKTLLIPQFKFPENTLPAEKRFSSAGLKHNSKEIFL